MRAFRPRAKPSTAVSRLKRHGSAVDPSEIDFLRWDWLASGGRSSTSSSKGGTFLRIFSARLLTPARRGKLDNIVVISSCLSCRDRAINSLAHLSELVFAAVIARMRASCGSRRHHQAPAATASASRVCSPLPDDRRFAELLRQNSALAQRDFAGRAVECNPVTFA